MKIRFLQYDAISGGSRWRQVVRLSGWLICLLMGLSAFAQQAVSSGRLARTFGKLPYLEYGPGDDRLGGAKIGYLDSQVLVRVVDSLAGDYIVQLSQRHRAFMPKQGLRFVEGTVPAYRLSGSGKVFGDESHDYVTLALPERLPYRSQMEIGPARLTVDIFGVTSNTNWLTQLQSAKEIRNTWYEALEDDVLRLHIDLRHDAHWGHRVYYDSTGSRLVVVVRRPPKSLDLRHMRIAVDAGHGGTNTGAAGKLTGLLEKDYTLLMARELERQLRRMGCRDVFMTRRIDTTIEMVDRALMLREAEPDLMVSLHLNSSSLDTVSGTGTFYRHIGFRPLSQSILHRMLQLGLKEYGNVGHFNFALSGPTEYPNCLVEVAFLSHVGDEHRIVDRKFHRDVAQKVSDGIRDWLKSMR
jgi:N-acetylmuramoyl-L-alanine amidase